jgi:membrane peptidoglycan carboxypeptidase
MVAKGWLDPAARTAATYPPALPDGGGTDLGIPAGPEGLIVDQVRAELMDKSDFGYTKEMVDAGGLRITTTVNKAYQDAAVTAVNDVMKGEDPTLRQALVAEDPKTGGVLAYYGNQARTSKDPNADTTDYAQAYKQPGSSFKPYTLATALENGFSDDTLRDGSSPQTFKDRPGRPVSNASNAQCAACTLKEAITKSLNTTFYGLAYDVGPPKVADTARAAMGVPATWGTDNSVPPELRGIPTLTSPENKETGGAIGIGEYEVRPVDQAAGFATLAAGGMYRQRHFVAQVADGGGTVLKAVTGAEHAKQVIPPDVTNDVTFAREDVAVASKRPLAGGRPVASKTGTQGLNNVDNSDAWMVGYTPSISTAVWMGTQGLSPIKNASGKIIYGAGLPGQIWQEFMNAALAGTPKEPLPSKALIKGDPSKSNVAAPATSAPAPVISQAPATNTQAPDSGAAPATSAPATAATTTAAQPTDSGAASSSGPAGQQSTGSASGTAGRRTG